MKYKLVPLRLHAGWEITYNSFTEYDTALHGREDIWELREDLLQLRHSLADLIIDLGWYPGSDPAGHYVLRMIGDKNWEVPLEIFTSRSKEEIAAHIEKWSGYEFYVKYTGENYE